MTDAAAPDELLVLNGIDVDTGGYLTPKLALTRVAGSLRGDAAPPLAITAAVRDSMIVATLHRISFSLE